MEVIILEEYFSIRPAGRHIFTIGRDLVQDKFAAIVELVKNAYDADATKVTILFDFDSKSNGLMITIKDDGHGMSRDVLLEKWLTLSTSDKKDRRESPKKRVMQGRKGIGRYAANTLGKDLELETVDVEGFKTSLYLLWEEFESASYLDDVKVKVTTEETDNRSGTSMKIHVFEQDVKEWVPFLSDRASNQMKLLKTELRKLTPPREFLDKKDKFEIYLEYKNFPGTYSIQELIEPFPLNNVYDYRIRGRVANNGGILYFENQRSGDPVEEIPFLEKTKCGPLNVDIRVYDREKEAIVELVGRGLGSNITEAKMLLNVNNGVGVYRNGFRIRPLGDPGFDWLRLDEDRVNNPSVKVGSNQIIGYVQIGAEEDSGLEEKSARDGLKHNLQYDSLKTIVRDIISNLESRRYKYRIKSGKSRKRNSATQGVEKLRGADIQTSVSKVLHQASLDDVVIEKVEEIIKREEFEFKRIANDLEDEIRTYQGQSTLGKIVNVILHEGRRPLNTFVNQIPSLSKSIERFNKAPNQNDAERIDRITKNILVEVESLKKLFESIDPLATKSRTDREEFNVYESIVGVYNIFENVLNEKNIKFEITGNPDSTLFGWKSDIYSIFTNLFDNSIFWISRRELQNGKIFVNVNKYKGGIRIEYRDSGPGIDPFILEDNILFDPGVTMKEGGMGLGLAIALESASRNSLKLTALPHEEGAHFILSSKGAQNDD